MSSNTSVKEKVSLAVGGGGGGGGLTGREIQYHFFPQSGEGYFSVITNNIPASVKVS